MPRRSAERRGRPQADVRGNAKHSWRSPYRPRTRMRSSEVPVRILPFAPFGAPPPLIFLEANAFVQWLAKPRAQKTRRENEIVRAFATSPAIASGKERKLRRLHQKAGHAVVTGRRRLSPMPPHFIHHSARSGDFARGVEPKDRLRLLINGLPRAYVYRWSCLRQHST